MKKLLTLAIFTAVLASCSNSDLADSVEPINQTYQNAASERSKSDSQLIENAISFVQTSAENSAYGKDDNPNIENPDTPIYYENPNDLGTILCGDNVNNNFGSACVWNNSGQLVRVEWQPKKELFWMEGPLGNSGTWLLPPDPLKPSEKTYTGTVVSSCNCR